MSEVAEGLWCVAAAPVWRVDVAAVSNQERRQSRSQSWIGCRWCQNTFAARVHVQPGEERRVAQVVLARRDRYEDIHQFLLICTSCSLQIQNLISVKPSVSYLLEVGKRSVADEQTIVLHKALWWVIRRQDDLEHGL